MANRIQFRRDTAANWASANPVLALGEQGVETDTGKSKVGDGATAWKSLGYLINWTDANSTYGREYRVRPDRAYPGYPVATNCYASGNGGNAISAASGTSRSPHKATADICDLRLVYGNHYVNNTTLVDVDGANTLTVNASIEYSGTIYRVTFGGRTSATIDPGGKAVSDPLGIEIPAGTLFYVRTWVSAAAAPYANLASYGSSGTGGFVATTDLTAPGAAAIADSIAWMYAPYAIIGTPTSRTAPSILIVGDSIASGIGDNAANGAQYSELGNGGGQAGGYIPRGLGTGAGRVNIANPSDKASNFIIAGNYARRIIYGSGCTHAICEYGINDVAAGTSLATIKSNLTTIWTALGRRGLKVYQSTITPKTTSTDSWATTTNQTVTANESVRTQLNDWIRTLPAPLTGYLEVADLAETARNSGIWKAGYTGDGTHPNSTGAAALAGALSASTFTA